MIDLQKKIAEIDWQLAENQSRHQQVANMATGRGCHDNRLGGLRGRHGVGEMVMVRLTVDYR